MNGHTADTALVRLFVSVRDLMSLQRLRLREVLVTDAALEALLAGVRQQVALHVGLLVEGSLADGADPRPQSRVREHVRPQVVLLAIKATNEIYP